MKEKRELILKGTCLFLFPLLGCLIYLAVRGISPADLYLPDSYNNDTLYYYKLVEAILHCGIPKGYFGFNESHALVGSFAAWSPLILLPWTLLGFLFGWSYSSILIFNVFLIAASMAAFGLLVDPKWKNILWLMILLGVFPNFWMHILVGMPEIVLISFVILYLGFALRSADETKEHRGCIGGMLAVGGFLTLIRPYLVLFLVLPCLKMIKKQKRRGIVLSGVFLTLILSIYFLISHYLTAPYLTPLFDLSLVKLFLSGHFIRGTAEMFNTMRRVLPQIGTFAVSAFRRGELAGVQYCVAIAGFVTCVFGAIREKDKNKRTVFFQCLLCGFMTFGAIVLLLQKANEGGRHILLFAVLFLILSSFAENRQSDILRVCLVIFMLFFVFRGALVSTDYDLGIRNEKTVEQNTYWTDVFAEQNISAEGELGYDNTVIWVLYDMADNQVMALNHRELYALPAGMGISCCERQYVIDSLTKLNSKYLATVSGGMIDALCLENGKEEIGRTDDLVIYRLR